MKKKRLVIGILAHVDAGKTTLAESMLYLSGAIRKLGRVDHKDAFLDTNEMEKARGITIFSKQAELMFGTTEVTLLDTPGHVDFSAEMERTLQVLDYAILVISGADGVQGHVQTLWRLLEQYQIPVFLFINKMDQEGTDSQKIMEELQKSLDERCIAFGREQDQEVFMENLAVCDEAVLEYYLEKGFLSHKQIVKMIVERKVFPCYFGSALKMTGVKEFMKEMKSYTECPQYPEQFGAKIYKIARDAQGNRLTYMKITGGTLKVKMALTNTVGDSHSSNGIWEEKADQIRIYSGSQFKTVDEAEAGMVCAVTGLTKTYSGQGLGIEEASDMPILEPVLTYKIQLPQGSNVHDMFIKLRQLEEEEPQLHIEESLNEIHAQVMGEVQIEILKHMIQERFGVLVEFGEGNIVYKETIKNTVEGVGHFEPLRHYAEVHLILEPGEPGSGMTFDSICSEDRLDRNWQRLILTHLEEKKHLGILTGSEITDMKITLASGKAHLKHTEGGDFRQATYRAVRHGLKRAESVLLEPVYEFRLELPSDMVGRAMTDIQKMHGRFQPPIIDQDRSILTGIVPVATMRNYQTEVTAYTKGEGRLFCDLKGYEPCHNAEEVIEKIGYDAEADLENPTGSVFCAHGAGFVVNWDQVEDYMHLESVLQPAKQEESKEERKSSPLPPVQSSVSWGDDKELEEIFNRTYKMDSSKRRSWGRETGPITREYNKTPKPNSNKEAPEEYLLVDGYNVIFAWEELKELAEVSIESARDKLMDILCDYQGYKKMTVILVFDAYKVKGNPGSVIKYHNIHVIYTKEAETADQYIEKAVHAIGRQHKVTVATSDGLEQVIIMGQGAQRLSSLGLKEEIEEMKKEIRKEYLNKPSNKKNYFLDHASEEITDLMEEVRLGKKTF